MFPFRKKKQVEVKVSLESQIERAVSMFTSAMTQLENVKNASIANREANDVYIAKLEADNARLSSMEANIDSKLEILKKLA